MSRRNLAAAIIGTALAIVAGQIGMWLATQDFDGDHTYPFMPPWVDVTRTVAFLVPGLVIGWLCGRHFLWYALISGVIAGIGNMLLDYVSYIERWSGKQVPSTYELLLAALASGTSLALYTLATAALGSWIWQTRKKT